MAKGTRAAQRPKWVPPTQLVKLAVWVRPDLAERARNAVAKLAGEPESLTLGKLVARALDERLTVLEKQYNRGRPFSKRSGELARGARPKF